MTEICAASSPKPYPSLQVEDGVASILSVIIEEFLLTTYNPAPRFFTVAQILR
jgi:hypothetical protein